MTIATKLSEARLLIETRGWAQGSYQSADGRLCMMGAVNAACGDGPCDMRDDYSIGRCRDLLMKAANTTLPYPAWWNDAPGRQQSEVIEAFKRAEQLARDGAE